MINTELMYVSVDIEALDVHDVSHSTDPPFMTQDN